MVAASRATQARGRLQQTKKGSDESPQAEVWDKSLSAASLMLASLLNKETELCSWRFKKIKF